MNRIKEIEESIKRRYSFMDFMRSESKVEDILMDLWILYQKNPCKIANYLNNCDIQSKFSSKKWFFPKEIERFRKINSPTLKYSQLYTDKRTMFKKLDLFKDSLNKFSIKKILILGDDDLLSIFLAANFNKLKIDVLEIDTRIINYIEKVSKKKRYKINTFHYDVREPLPKKFLKSYDYFFFDSSHCLGGYISFLTRVINCLSKNGFGGQFVIQLVDDIPIFTYKERKKLFNFIKSHGLKINKIEKKAVTYDCPEILIKRFIKELLNLFQQDVSKLKLISFLKRFGFSEFLPGVSLSPETIIELKITKNFKYPKNDFYDRSKEKKWGKMYFYQYYEKK
ncbi:MAG: bis-aminopropyl spermidine synthase family protein [Candidatus Pacearchaeota archaeon]